MREKEDREAGQSRSINRSIEVAKGKYFLQIQYLAKQAVQIFFQLPT